MSDKWIVDAQFPQGHLVPMTPDEQAAFDAYQASQVAGTAAQATADTNAALIRTELQSQVASALALADAIDANTATPAQQRQALSICLHGLVRLAKVVYRTYDQPA